MTSPIAIKIALANLSDEIDTEEIYQYIESNSNDLETYQLDSTKVTAAAIDYIAILSIVGSIASTASLLWMAYEKFIARKRQKNSDAGIYIVIHLSEKERIEFWIGKTHNDKDQFINEFTFRVTEFSKSKKSKKKFNEIKKDITHSGVWKKRK